MFLLTLLIEKFIRGSAGVYFIFLKLGHIPNWKGFPYQIWISVQRLTRTTKDDTFFGN